jgi:hypothetical protein
LIVGTKRKLSDTALAARFKKRLRVNAEYVEQKGIKPLIVGTMRKTNQYVQNGIKILVKGRMKRQISRQVISPNCIAPIAK